MNLQGDTLDASNMRAIALVSMPKVPMTTPDYLSKILRRAAHNGGITLKFNPNSKKQATAGGWGLLVFPNIP
jgi:hypothetical protein